MNGSKIVSDLIRNYEYHYPKITEEELLKMNNLFRVKAYYEEREFYQSNYDKETEFNYLLDTRNTLLWDPSVVTDENGEASIEFFCSDINTALTGSVEGVSGDGLPGTANFEIILIANEKDKISLIDRYPIWFFNCFETICI